MLLIGGAASLFLYAQQPVSVGDKIGPSGLILKGDFQAGIGNYEAAITLYNEALLSEPDYHEIHSRLGFVYYAAGEPAKSIEHFTRYTEIKSDDADGFYNLANALYMNNKYKPAMEAYESSLKLEPSHAESMVGIGNIHNDKKRYDEAMVWYQDALAINPDLGEAYEAMGWIYESKGQLEKSLEAFKNWVRIEPDSPQPHAVLALIYGKLGDEENAKKSRERYLELQKKKREAR